MIRVPKPVWDKIVKHVEEGYPNECCGILGGKTSNSESGYLVVGSTPAVNLNKERSRDRYLMDPKDIVRAQKGYSHQGQDILGYYHSHPDHPARPSETDRANAWPGYSYVILSVAKGKVVDYTSWVLNESDQQFKKGDLQIPTGVNT